MMFYFIGLAGEIPRLCLDNQDRANEQKLENEVDIASETIAEFVISSDGLSLEPFQPPLARLKESRKIDVMKMLAVKSAEGFPIASGPMIGERLQNRDDTDRTNWLTLKSTCETMIAAGQGEVAGATIRTQSNNNFTLTFSDCADLLQSMAIWGASLIARSWTLKDAIDAAVDETALNAIDIESGWTA